MSKFAVVYWSGTGNTEQMANAVAEGIVAAGGQAEVFTAADVGLFGSYGWGDGEWMRTWQAGVEGDGCTLVADGVIANEAPDDEALAACRDLGAKLVG